MIFIKSHDEIERIRDSNRIIVEIFKYIKDFIKPGITTAEINEEIENFILRRRAKPAFKGLYGFPSSSCISVQDEIVHGIPSAKRILKKGEIVGIDVGVELGGYYGDAAYTFAVDKVDKDIEKLIKVTEESLYMGIEKAVVSNRVGDISYAIQNHVEKNKFSVVRELVGHGVGKKPHEDPQIPNFGDPNKGIRLKDGMVLAIEPMVNMGTHEVYFAADKWTVKTVDGLPSAHFEHSVAITKNGPDILSKFDEE
jgi:methionyl aminopeptidase